MKRIIRILAITVTLAALLLTWAIAPVQAIASGWRFAAGIGSAQFFVGQQINNEGLLAYCTDYEMFSPDYGGNYQEAPPGNFVRSDGTALTEQENAALSYLLHRWGQTTDNATAAAVQLSVWAFSSARRGWDTPGMQEILNRARLPETVVALGRSLTEQSIRYAGPYQITAQLTPSGPVIATLVNPAGLAVPGLELSATATGSLRFPEATASNKISWLSTDSPRELAVQRTGFDAGSVHVESAAAPTPILNWLIPSVAKAQRLITSGVTSTLSATARLKADTAFQPLVATKTSNQRLVGPGSLYDDLLVSTAADAPWLNDPATNQPVQVTATSTLWGPFAQRPVESAEIPVDAIPVGSVSTLISGPGEYQTAALPVASPGYYVWTEEIDPAGAVPAAAKNFVEPWQSAFGTASETSLLIWTPTLSTQLSSHNVLPGSIVTDRVSLRGMPPSGAAENGNLAQLTLTMYGPLAEKPVQTEKVPVGSQPFQTKTVQALDGATVEFGPLQEPGCYTVVASIPGSEQLNALQSDFGEPSETVCVDQVPAAIVPPAAVVDELAATGPSEMQGIMIFAAALLGTGLACMALVRQRRATYSR